LQATKSKYKANSKKLKLSLVDINGKDKKSST